MQKDAIRHGQALVEKERELDRLFATGTINPDKLRAVLAEIGRLQAELRRVHLQAHLDQRAVLTPEQVGRYDTLRGYGSSAGDHSHGSHTH
jgi:Spy/CpxP family protein refolding chaperone